MCLAQGHNTLSHVAIKPRTSRFGVWCATTRLLHFPAKPELCMNLAGCMSQMKMVFSHVRNEQLIHKYYEDFY